jgi:hypothetical protein
MKKLILMGLLFSLPTLACVNRYSSAKFLHHESLECSWLGVNIIAPKLEVNGKLYALAIDREFSDPCPSGNSVCKDLSYGIDSRGNAICRSYGFKKQLNIRNFTPFHAAFGTVAALHKNKNGKFFPVIIKESDSWMVVSSILCQE